MRPTIDGLKSPIAMLAIDPHFYVAPTRDANGRLVAVSPAPCVRCGQPWGSRVHLKPNRSEL